MRYQPVPTARPNDAAVGLFYIARRLGKETRTVGWLCTYVQALVEHHGFPTPFPHMRKGDISLRVTGKATWDRRGVDAWFDDRLPSHLAVVYDNSENARYAAELDRRAGNLAA